MQDDETYCDLSKVYPQSSVSAPNPKMIPPVLIARDLCAVSIEVPVKDIHLFPLLWCESVVVPG